MPEPLSKIEAQCTLVDVQLMRPPLQRLVFDINVTNHSTELIWVLLPSVLNPTSSEEKYSVYGVSCYQDDTEPLMLYQLSGAANYWAFSLDGNGSVTFRKLPILLWPDEKATDIELELMLGSHLHIAHQEINSAVNTPKALTHSSEISFDNLKMVSKKTTEELLEVPFDLVNKSSIQFHFGTSL